ncbi:hypothetical protein FA09DRAFT_262419 [Tilletiopsis washingtonensis]|jgi:hypothetical protein|uniref:Uncharacterized protein n=1 Tax=Tilletiopsis washingtonensis TaxID=58919 RepID=A0A316ZA18_9BASI|nr:hypothetical protein FA09DRAFT_262419 [Tilletiopsis washingtonensis]PWN98409.1 hypothetical protein FA09DRAFT_262419 [Tilletiopsis washingtonensis]
MRACPRFGSACRARRRARARGVLLFAVGARRDARDALHAAATRHSSAPRSARRRPLGSMLLASPCLHFFRTPSHLLWASAAHKERPEEHMRFLSVSCLGARPANTPCVPRCIACITAACRGRSRIPGGRDSTALGWQPTAVEACQSTSCICCEPATFCASKRIRLGNRAAELVPAIWRPAQQSAAVRRRAARNRVQGPAHRAVSRAIGVCRAGSQAAPSTQSQPSACSDQPRHPRLGLHLQALRHKSMECSHVAERLPDRRRQSRGQLCALRRLHACVPVPPSPEPDYSIASLLPSHSRVARLRPPAHAARRAPQQSCLF